MHFTIFLTGSAAWIFDSPKTWRLRIVSHPWILSIRNRASSSIRRGIFLVVPWASCLQIVFALFSCLCCQRSGECMQKMLTRRPRDFDIPLYLRWPRRKFLKGVCSPNGTCCSWFDGCHGGRFLIGRRFSGLGLRFRWIWVSMAWRAPC